MSEAPSSSMHCWWSYWLAENSSTEVRGSQRKSVWLWMPIVVVTPFLGVMGVISISRSFPSATVRSGFLSPVTILDRIFGSSSIFFNYFLQADMRASICSFFKKCGSHVDETRSICKWSFRISLKLAVHLSFLASRHVHALFHKIVNQSLYTSYNITNFIHLWFCDKLDEKLVISSSLTFHENIDRLARTLKREMWKMIGKMVCEMTSRFVNIFSHSLQFDNKYIAGFRLVLGMFTGSAR